MRIALIAPPWVSVPPVAYGGTEAVLDALAQGLQAAGHEVLLCTTGDSTCPVPKTFVLDQAAGVGRGGAGTELRHVIHSYAEAADYDVIHDHTLSGPFYAHAHSRVPVVTTNHGPFSGELGDVYRGLGQRTPVIAISAHHASTAVGVNLAGVIHHGLVASDFRVGPGGDYAVFLGRMSPDKGVATAARVARAAGIPLLIAAKLNELEEREYFAREVEPLLGHGVEYIGEVDFAEKVRLLGNARCLLNPIAWAEPFGMVMIEALACGTPVITTPCGAAPEIVRHGVTGLLCADEEALVQAVGVASELDRSACRRAVEGHFSARRMVEDHLLVYERVIAGLDAPQLTGTPPHAQARISGAEGAVPVGVARTAW